MSAPIALASRLGAAAFVLLVSGPLLARLGAVEPSAGHSLSSMSGIASALGCGIAMVAFLRRDLPSTRWRWFGVGAAFVTTAVTMGYAQLGSGAHHWDASTSRDAPPEFVARAVPTLTAADQVEPLELPEGPDVAFERVANAVDGLGWRVVRTAPRHLEATAKSGVFGFVHDVAVDVRVTTSSVTVVHARARSRSEQPDRGANAALLHSLWERLR